MHVEGKPSSLLANRLAVAGLVVVAIVVSILVTVPWGNAMMREMRERRQSFDILANLASRNELEEAVTRLGVVLDLPGGEWIAIRCRDSHAWPGFSVAVALTSDGRWLESTYHYCGQFAGYRHAVAHLDEAIEFGDPEYIAMASERFNGHEHYQRLRRIDTKCTLAEAVDELLAMHFRLSTDTRPARLVAAAAE